MDGGWNVRHVFYLYNKYGIASSDIEIINCEMISADVPEVIGDLFRMGFCFKKSVFRCH